MEFIATKLQQVIDAKEDIDVVYNGGSAPGTIRRLAPLKITGKKLAAYCRTSNARKTFMLAKIGLPGEQHTGEGWHPKQYNENLTLPLFHEELMEMEYPQSLNINLYSREGTEDILLTVGVYFKNGKPKKTPELSFSYKADREDDDGNIIKRQRKWIVSEKQGNARSYTHIESAVTYFMSLFESIK